MIRRLVTSALVGCIALSAAKAEGASSREDYWGGIAYTHKRLGDFDESLNGGSLLFLSTLLPKTDETDRAAGFGMSADISYMTKDDVTSLTLDLLLGYQWARKDKWSFLLGAGVGYHDWSVDDGTGLGGADFPLLLGADWTIGLSKSARVMFGYRRDFGDDPELSAGGITRLHPDLSGDRFTVGFIFDWWGK